MSHRYKSTHHRAEWSEWNVNPRDPIFHGGIYNGKPFFTSTREEAETFCEEMSKRLAERGSK